MTSRSEWLSSPSDKPAYTHVSPDTVYAPTHLKLTSLRELIAWRTSLGVTPGSSLFLVREDMPRVPPIPMPGKTYDPRSDPEVAEFLRKAYDSIEFWVGGRSTDDTKACIRALLDPLSCQAAWPSPQGLLETEQSLIKLIEGELVKGASPLRVLRKVLEHYAITPVQAREVAGIVLMEIVDNDNWERSRRMGLLEIAYSGDIREGVDSQDRRLATAARTNQARAHGLITTRPDTKDQEDLTKSIIDAMARVGKQNPVALPPTDES